MKKLFALSLIVMTAMLGGCLTSEDSKDDEGGDTGNGGSWKVSGYVKIVDVNGAGIKDVSVALMQNAKTQVSVKTNSDGYYEFTKIADGTYMVVPVKSGYTFVPVEVANVTVAGKDVAVQTFVGTASGGTSNPGTGTAGSHTYAPFKLNAKWTYNSVFDADGFASTSEYVETVVGTQSYSGKTYWMLKSADINTYYTLEDTTLIRVDNATVYGFFTADLVAKRVPKTAKAARIAKTLAYEYGSEMPIYKFGLGSGQTWTIYDSGVYNGNSMKLTGKSLGTETVTVPAGTFSNCAKLEITVLTTMKDTSGTWTSSSVTTEWFAPNVGRVKASETSTNTHASSEGTETTVYKYNDDLKSYSIP